MRFAFHRLFNSKMLHNLRSLHVSQNVRREAYDGPGKTTVTILNKNETSLLLITSYNQAGFTLNNGIKMVGPMVLFSKSLLYWNIASAKDINKDSLVLFSVLEPKLDLLIIGLEEDYEYEFIANLKKTIKDLGINSEILPVDQACSIFNFVNLENRYVAAALIPPKRNSLFSSLNTKISKKKNPVTQSESD